MCAILLQPAIPIISTKLLNRLGIPLESRLYEDACDSFAALDGEQFERVGRLLGPKQGHLYMSSKIVAKQKDELQR